MTADFLGELLRGGSEDDGGFEMGGIFFDGFEIERDDGALGKVVARPSGFQSSLSSTMIWPSSMP